MKKTITFLLLTAILIAGCSSSADLDQNESTEPFEWEYSDALYDVIEEVSIQEMYEYIKDRELDYSSLIIVKDQKIILEDYFDSEDPNAITALFSATKSINSALVGIAIDQGLIPSVEEPVLPYFTDEFNVFNRSQEKESVTIWNVLTMSCGFNWPEWDYSYGDPRNIYNSWKNSGNRFKFLLDASMREMPGESFNYNTAASNLIPYIINKSSGMNTEEFAQENLFGPLGISAEDYIWSKDNLGYNKGGGLNMRPLDMAKIGLLYLNEGEWEGRQIVPKEWIASSFEPQFDVRLGTSLGYHWYINKFKDITFYSAEGYMEQKIIVCPEKDLVVVFTGDVVDYFRDNSDVIFKKYILMGMVQ